MKPKKTALLLSILLGLHFSSFSQRGKHSAYTTVTGASTVLNTYVKVPGNVTAGATTITVSNIASLTAASGPLTTAIGAGDLIMIIQMQGASIDIDDTPVTSWGNQYTTPSAHLWDGNWPLFAHEWGQITNYNNAGKFEQVEVKSVAGNVITLQCALTNSYTATGNVQVVRIPRFQDLTVNGSASIVPTAWSYATGTGGIVAIEVNGTFTMNSGSLITATGYGFQGGVADNAGLSGSGAPVNTGVGSSFLGSPVGTQGARKGESIAGYTAEYNAKNSVYGRGAPANGGGGGGIQNSGGGGGCNVATGTYTGKGVPSTAYNAAWNLENAGFAGSSSPGGGRGGYTYSTSNQDALTVGPSNAAWSGDQRRINGGLGGHALVYDATRVFMGGGGGAGDQDSGQGGAGGNGGGIVMVTCYGTITGTGAIESNGANGNKTNPLNQTPPANTTQKRGNDGAGGAGGAGSIIIRNSSAVPGTIALNANGGTGGNVVLTLSAFASPEGNGPGGGGSGGFIAKTSGAAPMNVNGGAAGTTNSAHLSEMPVNGATAGAPGMTQTSTIYDIIPNNITVCQGQPISLSVSVTGTSPGTLQWFSGPYTSTALSPGVGAGGLTYTPSPAPTTTTTYYVGVCSGTFRVPVTVTVNPAPTISGTAVITNAGCTTPGSITGLTASGGTGTLDYTWNGASSVSTNLSNASTGSYTLVVTDDNGCTATSGPHVIGGTAGPSINSSGVVITNEICNGTLGSISGLTATGTSLTYSWSPSGGTNLNPTGLAQGAYTVTATDNVGCTATAGPFNVGFTPGPTVNTTAVVTSDETCSQNNGTITGITASGNGLNYSWSNGGGSALNASGLNQGSYTLTVTDINGCTATAGPYVLSDQTGPTLNASGINIQNEICSQGNGSISGISATGGTGTLNYSWTNTAQTTIAINNLSANTYTLTVTDQNGCTATSGPHTILNQGGPVFDNSNVVINDVSCLGTLGSITGITVTGTGVQLLWNPGGQTTLNATNLTAGTYTLGAIDANGCAATSGPYTVGTIVGPSINTSGQVVTNESCSNNNGSITGITASGNSVSYSWNNGGGNSANASNLTAGNYTLTVTDAIGCTATAGPITIIDNAGPTIDASNAILSDEHCGQADGLILGIDVNGGNAPVGFAWTNTSQTTLDITDLSANSYSLTATDALGCTATAGPFVINNIAAPVVNTSAVVVTGVSCTGTLGSITGLTTTPSTGLTYTWTNGAGSALTASNLNPGSYSLTVEDAFGCQGTAGPFTINPSNDITIDISGMNLVNSSCTVDDGSISGITYTGGTNPTVSWSTGQGTLDINNLAPGTYTLTVSDAFGCSDQTTADINTVNGPIIDASSVILSPSHCMQTDGTITGIFVSGGTPVYTYMWNGTIATPTPDLGNVAGGNYDLLVTDDAGCTDQISFVLPDVAGPIIDESGLTLMQPSCINTGQISGLQASGSSTLTYTWQGSTLNSIDLVDVFGGTYILTATDAFGCQATSSPIVLIDPVPPTANFTWNPSSPNVDDLVTFQNSSVGTNLTYDWTIDTLSTSTQQNPTQIFSAEGQYLVTLEIVDQNGCTDSVSYVVTVYGTILVPNVITANGDGQNDKFEIKGLKPNTTVYILNRWGNVVFSTNNYDNSWGGNDLKGTPLTEGVYTYKILPENDNPKTGFVHLIR